MAGVHDFKWQLFHNHSWAKLNLFFNKATDGVSTIDYGFRVTNSVDGASAINYGFKVNDKRKQVIDVWGMRQVCSNGMMIRVPLEWHYAFVGEDISDKDVRTELRVLLKETARIPHLTNAEDKIKSMQYVAEAMSLLQKPIERIISLSQKWTFENEEEIKKLIKKYVGERMLDTINAQFGKEEETLWGLYNAITYVASHNEISQRTSLSLQEKAGKMLTEVLIQTHGLDGKGGDAQ